MAGKYRNDQGRRPERYVSPRVKWTIALASIALIAVAVFAVAVMQGWIQLPQLPDRPKETTPPTIAAGEDTVIHFVAGGDVNVTDRTVNAGGSGYEFGGALLDVLPVLSGADLTALNFEGNVCGEPYGSEMKSAPTQLLTALKNAGVDVLQTANSQSLTNGMRGLQATAEAIRNAGMQNLGTYANESEFQKYEGYLIYEIQGIRIAMVSFTKGMDGRNLPQGSENCVNLLYTDYSSTYKKVNKEGITRIIRSAKEKNPDIIIAMLHWGSEHNDQISTTQKEICTLMSELGVSAVIGTHSHYVQGMGFNPENGMFVAYSLGDFLGDAQVAGTNYSVLLDLEITKDGGTGKVSITGFDYTPIYQYYDEDGNLQILRLRQAIAAYEDNYIAKVPKEVYDSMVSALARIENRVNSGSIINVGVR